MKPSWRPAGFAWPALLVVLLVWLAVGCAAPPAQPVLNLVPTVAPVTITLTADGRSTQLSTTAATVGDLLAEAGILLGPADEVTPSLATPVDAARGAVTIVRVTDRLETETEPVPFGRRTVRTSELPPTAPPRILQEGLPGQTEVTVRVVLRDGVESERWPTSTRLLKPPRDEIVLVGVGASTTAFPIEGTLAAIDDGRAIVWSRSTDNPTQLPVEGALDGRVFQLSPDGSLLLYSAATAESAEAAAFGNGLWVIETNGEGAPRPLGVENVLWAAWDPAQVALPRLAYTTARATALPPGWEANNDLWLLEYGLDAAGNAAPGAPIRLIETYPATYGWWGGRFAWSPTGDQVAYGFADEIGTVAMPAQGSLLLGGVPGADQTVYQPLTRFTAYDTRSDWAWVPALAWAPDGSALLATVHANDDPLAADPFDQVLVDAITGDNNQVRPEAGMWAFSHWSPTAETPVATLLATDPEASQDSSYTLWLSRPDGRSPRRIYPPEGENSHFPRVEQFMAWSPSGRAIAFIFDDALTLMDLESGEVYQPADDDRRSSHPSWAPYGAAVAEP